MGDGSLEDKIAQGKEISDMIKKAWSISHIFGNRVPGHVSYSTYQQFENNGLSIEVLQIADFCGTSGGHVSIKKHSDIIFYFDYGECQLENQFLGADKSYVGIIAGTSINCVDHYTKKEISDLYDLSIMADKNVTSRERKKAEHDKKIEELVEH